MSKLIKGMIEGDLRRRFQGVDSACVVDLTGLSVQAQEKLRATVRSKSGRMEVVKNSLARRAFRGGPLEVLGDALIGPCAIITSRESMIEVAKALMQAAREFKNLKLKKAVVEGDPSLLTVEEVSRLRGRRELLGEVAMLISSPGRAIAGCLAAPQSKIAGCLKAIVEKGEPAAA